MNPLNPLLWKALGVIAMIAVGIGLGYKATSAYYSPKVVALETQLKAANERADSFEQSYNAVAVAAHLLDIPLTLGLPPKEIVLLMVTLLISAITLAGGRATVLHGAVHLVLFGAFIHLSIVP